jgi:ferredoxin
MQGKQNVCTTCAVLVVDGQLICSPARIREYPVWRWEDIVAIYSIISASLQQICMT